MSNATAILKENNVQGQTARIIPFRQKELLLVDCAGQPFVPMKPIVQGMGLDWKSQHAKLSAGRFSSTMVEITTVALDGKQREMTCLPLRKLTGWLMSIHPNKVRPELREGIIAYQNECDDVLWSYWNNGMAVRTHDRNAVTVIAELVGVTELTVLKGLVYDKAKAVPKDKRISFIHTMHNRLHTRFNVPRVELIPAQQFEAACNFVAAYALEGEWIEAEKPAQPGRLNIHYPIDFLASRRPEMIYPRNKDSDFLDMQLSDLGGSKQSPCELILAELNKAGYNIDAAWWEVRTYRNKVESLGRALECVKATFEGPQQYVLSKKTA